MARTKPDPELYATALDRLGVEPTEAVALEDSHHGTVSAAAAGLAVVAVPNRVTAGQDFAKATPRRRLDDAADNPAPGVARRLLTGSVYAFVAGHEWQ